MPAMAYPSTGVSTPAVGSITGPIWPLTGWLKDVYQPIDIVTVDEFYYWGHSEALGLDVCWENGHLRWYDPAAQRYLRTFDEEAEERVAAEERVRELEAEIRRLQG